MASTVDRRRYDRAREPLAGWRDRFVGGMLAALAGGVAVGVAFAAPAVIDREAGHPLLLFGYLGGVFTALAAVGILAVGLPVSALFERRPARSTAGAVARYAATGLMVGPLVGALFLRAAAGWSELLVAAPVGAAVGGLAATLARTRQWGPVAVVVAGLVTVLGAAFVMWLTANAITQT